MQTFSLQLSQKVFTSAVRWLPTPKLLLGGIILAAAISSSQQANAAIQFQSFNGIRPDDGDILNFIIFYDDTTLFSTGSSVLCGPDPSSNPAPGCYVDNTSNGLLTGTVLPSFTGYKITNVTGSYYDKVDDETYNVLGLYAAGSFEGGVGPAIDHYVSDNLFNPNNFYAALSSGGIVVSTDNPDYQYHLFIDKATGSYAGCGSGTCKKVTRVPVPGPIPLLGAFAAFGYSRKLRKRVQANKNLIPCLPN